MARKFGARVYATVPPHAQRKELATRFSLPLSHVLFDSDMRLNETLSKLTAGKGMDVVFVMPDSGPAPDLGGCIAALGVYVQIVSGREKACITPPTLN